MIFFGIRSMEASFGTIGRLIEVLQTRARKRSSEFPVLTSFPRNLERNTRQARNVSAAEKRPRQRQCWDVHSQADDQVSPLRRRDDVVDWKERSIPLLCMCGKRQEGGKCLPGFSHQC